LLAWPLREIFSDERCARDQETIEAYHLGRYGHMSYGPVWGHTRDELFENHQNHIFAGLSTSPEFAELRIADEPAPLPEPGASATRGSG
jgi:hypothetical protein